MLNCSQSQDSLPGLSDYEFGGICSGPVFIYCFTVRVKTNLKNKYHVINRFCSIDAI